MQSPRHTSEAEADVEAEYTGSLPNRLINPGEYEPVLPTTEEHTAAELTEDKEAVNEELRRLIPVYNYNAVKQYCVFWNIIISLYWCSYRIKLKSVVTIVFDSSVY